MSATAPTWIARPVVCLHCGAVYAKPAGETALANPGCPSCRYLGWRPVAVDAARVAGIVGARRHSCAPSG
jgi:hypothetical protein